MPVKNEMKCCEKSKAKDSLKWDCKSWEKKMKNNNWKKMIIHSGELMDIHKGFANNMG